MLGTAPVGSALHHLYGYWRVAADAARFTSLDSHNLAANYGNYAVYLPKSLGNDAADLGKVMVPQKWEPCRGSPGGGASPGRKVARETRERLHLAEQPAGRRVRRGKNAKPQTRQVIYIIPKNCAIVRRWGVIFRSIMVISCCNTVNVICFLQISKN